MAIDEEDIAQQVKAMLAEDVGGGDITARLLPAGENIRAEIISREPMMLCGSAWVEAVFAELSPDVQCRWLAGDGDWLEQEQVLLELRGPVRPILTGERTALNLLQTLSATATATRQYVSRLQDTGCRLMDTRKTLPGFRHAQKYAVRCGGGVNHRMGLYDAFLIKENHIATCGSITAAVVNARSMRLNKTIEVEVENIDQLNEVLPLNPDRIMLDNFPLDMMRKAVELNAHWQSKLEASGGITLDNVRDIALTGVDFVSVGAITKSINAIDLSLLVRERI